MRDISEVLNIELKKNQSEKKNVINEIKNTLNGINRRLNAAEERINEINDSVMDSNQAEQMKEKKKHYVNENRFGELSDYIKYNSISTLQILEDGEGENGAENL